jgi:integrase
VCYRISLFRLAKFKTRKYQRKGFGFYDNQNTGETDCFINFLCKKILNKYGSGLPEPIADTNMNKHLKEMGKLCGIDDEVQMIKISGNKRTQTKQPKYKLITTHTARRIFVTQSLERGIRPEVVMKITGHKDYKTMMRYVKITDNILRDEML